VVRRGKKSGAGETEWVSPAQFLLQLYDVLLQQGWTMNEIDEMDIFYYLKVLRYRIGRREHHVTMGFIDHVL
jgi:hypothetical protein